MLSKLNHLDDSVVSGLRHRLVRFVPVDVCQVVPGEVRREALRGKRWVHLPHHFCVTCVEKGRHEYVVLLA